MIISIVSWCLFGCVIERRKSKVIRISVIKKNSQHFNRSNSGQNIGTFSKCSLVLDSFEVQPSIKTDFYISILCWRIPSEISFCKKVQLEHVRMNSLKRKLYLDIEELSSWVTRDTFDDERKHRTIPDWPLFLFFDISKQLPPYNFIYNLAFSFDVMWNLRYSWDRKSMMVRKKSHHTANHKEEKDFNAWISAKPENPRTDQSRLSNITFVLTPSDLK